MLPFAVQIELYLIPVCAAYLVVRDVGAVCRGIRNGNILHGGEIYKAFGRRGKGICAGPVLRVDYSAVHDPVCSYSYSVRRIGVEPGPYF